MRILLDGLTFGESLRWHRGRLVVCDWAAGQVIAVGESGSPVVLAQVPSFPLCVDHLPDGRMLLVDSAQHRVLRQEPDGALVVHADLAPFGTTPWNEIVVDARGNAYVNGIGFDFPDGDYAPGRVVLVRPDGVVVPVAEDLAFPNGMAVSADGRTLLVAESYAEQVTAFDLADDATLGARRVWASTPGDHPDGICLDVEGALWYADVGNRHCVRIREGGEVLAIVDLDRGAFSCTVSREEPATLFVVGQEWGGAGEGPSGQVVAVPAPALGAAPG